MDLLNFFESAINTKHLSDIHLNEGENIKARINGDVLTINSDCNTRYEAFSKLLSALDMRFAGNDPREMLDERGESTSGERDGIDFAAFINKVRMRCNLSLSNGRKLYLVMRRLNSVIPELDSLGLPAIYKDLILRGGGGLCLVTGATGSGKSTTLASSLNYINKTLPLHILSLEDPVEYVIKGDKCLVNQKEVGGDVAAYIGGMRSSLRQDPDIVMIGEIRDLTTMRAAMTLAQTGHTVFGTMHTNGAISTIERCISFYPTEEKDLARFELSGVLNLVLSQVLVKRKDGDGRVMAYEFMIKTSGIRQNIEKGQPHLIKNAMETGSTEGHVLMHQILAKYVKQGVITPQEALSATNDYDRLKKELSL